MAFPFLRPKKFTKRKIWVNLLGISHRTQCPTCCKSHAACRTQDRRRWDAKILIAVAQSPKWTPFELCPYQYLQRISLQKIRRIYWIRAPLWPFLQSTSIDWYLQVCFSLSLLYISQTRLIFTSWSRRNPDSSFFVSMSEGSWSK